MTEVRSLTFYEDRAEVVRGLVTRVPAGGSRVRIAGISPVIDDASLLVGAEGALVRGARVLRRVVESGADADALAALEEEARRCDRALADAVSHLGRLRARQARGEALVLHVASGLELAPSTEGWAEAWSALSEEHRPVLAALGEATIVHEEAARAAEHATRRLAEARVRTTRFEAEVEVQLDAAAEREVSVSVRYLVPCALWRPAHVARLAGGRLTIQTCAVAWQATGERWEGVPARFSTARPGRAASPPPLTDDVLALRQKTEEERRQIVAETREVVVTTAGLEGGRAVDEMPGVEDGGEPVWYTNDAVQVASDGRPTWIPVGEEEVVATVETVAWPESGCAAHVRATAVRTGGPLLAGPVRLLREGVWVGTGRVDFVPAGEPFELGFGADDALRVRRSFEDQRETTAILGTQKLTRTVHVWVSNLSDRPRRLRVLERMPVSELSEVRVTLESGDVTPDADGRLSFVVELEPSQAKELRYRWRLEADAKVRLGM